jgi:hypothetical protein
MIERLLSYISTSIVAVSFGEFSHGVELGNITAIIAYIVWVTLPMPGLSGFNNDPLLSREAQKITFIDPSKNSGQKIVTNNADLINKRRNSMFVMRLLLGIGFRKAHKAKNGIKQTAGFRVREPYAHC